MPAHFGGSPLGTYTYADVTTIGITYRTERAALSQFVPECFEITDSVIETHTAAWRAEGVAAWQVLSWQQNPTQAHIIEALTGLPIEEYVGSLVTVGSQVIRVDAVRELAW